MTNSITNRQLFFIIFLTLTSYSTIELPNIMVQTAGRSSWIAIIIMAFIYAFTAVIITKLNNMFHGKVLFDYSQELVGKFFTYVIAIYYMLVSLMIGGILKVKLVSIVHANFLHETPKAAILAIGVILFGYVVYKGITNIARMYEIIGTFFISITLLICIFMIFQGMSDNILPIFKPSETKKLLLTMKNLITPFTGLGILLVIPFTEKNKDAPKVAFYTLLFIGLFYIIIVESTIIILGVINTATLSYAFIEAIKMVKFPVIERTDIFYLTFGLMSLFAGTITIFLSAVEFACRIFSKVNRLIIVIFTDIVLYALSLFALQIKNVNGVIDLFVPYIVLFTSILIPVTLFFIANFKNRAK